MENKLAYQPNKITALRALHDSILVTDMKFTERVTSSGIVLRSDDAKSVGIRPRWARVYATGPEQNHVQVGQYVLVAHGRWTRGINIQEASGEVLTIRRIDNDEILLVSDEPQSDETLSDKEV